MKLKLATILFSTIFGILICHASIASPNKDREIIVAPFCYNSNHIYPSTGAKGATMRFKWSDDEFEKAKEYLEKIIVVLPSLNKRTDVCPNNDKLIASIGFVGVGQELKKLDSEIPDEFKVDPKQITPDDKNVVFLFPENNEENLKKMFYLYTLLNQTRERNPISPDFSR
jgi:hypothetical protein